MSDLVLAEKDPAVVLAAALELYRVNTISPANPNGVVLAPADPRRLHLQTLLLLLSQQRQLIDFSGKQSLLRFVSDEWIDLLAALWGEERLASLPSKCTVVFTATDSVLGPLSIDSGKRVSDGKDVWSVDAGGPFLGTGSISLPVTCTVPGSQSNGIAPGQINVMFDPIPGVVSAVNSTETAGGRDLEALEPFRTRLRGAPENRSTCGPRIAYEQAALVGWSTFEDAFALGANDSGQMAGPAPNPGEVHVFLIEGARDTNGALISVIPNPSGGLLTLVGDVLSGEDQRPLTDSVIMKTARFVNVDVDVTYYISRSRSRQAEQIVAAVEAAHLAYLLWQQSSIGRDVNPSELTTMLVNAGAKRVAISSPVFSALKRDESALVIYDTLTYGGLEDD
jgi:phage-related baseplate assembly protein